MRQQACLDREGANTESVVGFELVKHVRLVQHARPVQCEDGVGGAVRRVDGERGWRRVAHPARAEQRVEVGAVIGVPVTEQHGVNGLNGASLKQARHRGISGVDEKAEPCVLDQIAAAPLRCRGPRTATPENR
jgi:hypothetical protein